MYNISFNALREPLFLPFWENAKSEAEKFFFEFFPRFPRILSDAQESTGIE
jgi:hypothetical protein